MHKLFTLEEIKIAAMDALAAMDQSDPDTVVDTLRGMQLLIGRLADQMKEPEAVSFDIVQEAEPAAPQPEKAKGKPDPNGPVKIVQPGKFFGTGAPMKRRTWERMMELRTADGRNINEISAMTHGKVTPEEVRAMCGTKKVPLAQWEILAEALGTKEASA